MKKLYLIVATGLFLLITNSVFAQEILFVGDGCPHCTNVEEYFSENNIQEKFDIKILEVFKHPENQIVYEQETRKAGYNGGGVPILIVNGEYIIGDYPIINYYEERLKNQKEEVANTSSEKLQENIKAEVPVPATSAEESSNDKPSTTLTEEELNEMKDLAAEENLTEEIVDNSPKTENKWSFSYGNNKYYYLIGFIFLMTIIEIAVLLRKRQQ